MAKGRKPKPNHLKLIDGNPGKRAIEKPKVAPSRPIAPHDMTAEAKREWSYVVPHLDALGLLHKVDRAALRAYCELVSTNIAATRDLEKRGYFVEGADGGIVKNPAVSVQTQTATQIRLFSSEFGLTAASRMRLELPDPSATAGGEDPLEDVLDG